MRATYFNYLKETSTQVDAHIQRILEEKKLKNPLNDFVEILPKRRLGKPRLRDALLRLSYETSKGDNWEEKVPPFAAAIELFNNSTYIINWVLDEKGDLQTKQDEKSAINAGMMLREIAQEEIGKQNMDLETKLIIIEGLSKVNTSIYESQNMDLFELTIDNFKRYQEEDTFLKALYEKGRLACGYFSAWIAKTGNQLGNKNKQTKDTLENFALQLSSGIQLANDAGDFIPKTNKSTTPDKSYKDQCTDICNGRLTLTAWHCLKYGTKEQGEYLKSFVQRKRTAKEQEKLVYTLKDAASFQYVIQQANKIYSNCRAVLHTLPESQQKDLLLTMASIIRTNKFYATLREKYQAI